MCGNQVWSKLVLQKQTFRKLSLTKENVLGFTQKCFLFLHLQMGNKNEGTYHTGNISYPGNLDPT